jgi:hypothetical protein
MGAGGQAVDLGRPATGMSVQSVDRGRPATGAGVDTHHQSYNGVAEAAPPAQQPVNYGPPEPIMEYIGKVDAHRQQKMSYYGHQQRNIYGVGVASLIQEHQPPPQPQIDAQQLAEHQAQVAAYQQQQMQMLANNYYENEHLKQMRPHMAAGDPYNQQFRPQRTRAQGQESYGVSSMFNGPFATG